MADNGEGRYASTTRSAYQQQRTQPRYENVGSSALQQRGEKGGGRVFSLEMETGALSLCSAALDHHRSAGPSSPTASATQEDAHYNAQDLKEPSEGSLSEEPLRYAPNAPNCLSAVGNLRCLGLPGEDMRLARLRSEGLARLAWPD